MKAIRGINNQGFEVINNLIRHSNNTFDFVNINYMLSIKSCIFNRVLIFYMKS